MSVIRYREAGKAALRGEMLRNHRVALMGADIGVFNAPAAFPHQARIVDAAVGKLARV